tara:strand:- start:32 stop:322 length:291 start_codon:yes stop_codon:yes gene_type:complete
MRWKKGEKEKLKKIIKQVSGNIDDIEGELLESAKIQGTGDLWCYAPLSNRMIRVCKGTRVYIISEKEDEEGMVLAYTATVDVVLIKKDDLMEVGFN